MENRTEIGNALREKLASLEKTPNVDLWNKIATDLNRRKKRRTAFWLYSSILSLGLITCLLIYFNDDSKSKPIIDNQKTNEKANFNKDSVNKFKINEANQIKIDDSVLFKNQNKSLKSVQLSDKNIVKILSNSLKDSFQKKNTKSSKNSKNFYKKTTRLVKSTSDYDEFEVITKQKYFFKKYKNKAKPKTSIVYNLKKSPKNKFKNIKKQSKISKTNILSASKNTLEPDFSLVKEDKFVDKNSFTVQKKDSTPIDDKTIFDKTNLKKVDKKIKKLVDTAQPKQIELPKMSLVISAYFGPSYFNSFGSENYIVNENSSGSKGGRITYNYGFYLRWMANQKAGLRLGLGRTNYSYTVDVSNNNNFIESPNVSLQNYNASQLYGVFEGSPVVVFTQKNTYYELPVEGYIIMKDFKKFEIATNFGLSFLFLDKNETTLKSNTISEFQIGSNNNVLNFGYTANLGLNFSYKISNRINFDVSPSVKYQFIELIRNSNFNPFSLNLQTGFSYKF